jgi:CDP-diacylglycerol--serine O-phosphatidyltransferase
LPNRKYFVGLPIPAAAGMIAAVVFVADSYPVTSFYQSAIWLALLALLSFLMVSTWRYWSFKELNLLRPRSPILLVVMCGAIYAIWNWSQPVLLILAGSYVASGILIRAGGIVRRHFRPRTPTPGPSPEAQIG